MEIRNVVGRREKEDRNYGVTLSGIVSRWVRDLCETLARQMGRLCPKFLGSHLLQGFLSFLWLRGSPFHPVCRKISFCSSSYHAGMNNRNHVCLFIMIQWTIRSMYWWLMQDAFLGLGL
jgi:hypothetical protein